MSRVGKLPITIPGNVTVNVDGQKVTIKGSKGELSHVVNSEIAIELQDNQLILTRTAETKSARAFHGLNRSLLQNMVLGVSNGFLKKLEIVGVGYRANLKGKTLELSLGYSHPINYPIPADVNINVDPENKNILVVDGVDKQRVGQVASEIREFRKPEPYKGKGIRYVGEYIRRKAGKSGGKDK